MFFLTSRDRRSHADRPEGSGKVNKLLGVIGSPDAEMDHVIVTGAFALRAQAVERIPGQRMKPVNGGRQAADLLKTQHPTA